MNRRKAQPPYLPELLRGLDVGSYVIPAQATTSLRSNAYSVAKNIGISVTTTRLDDGRIRITRTA